VLVPPVLAPLDPPSLEPEEPPDDEWDASAPASSLSRTIVVVLLEQATANATATTPTSGFAIQFCMSAS
jgi:hypothetical protein